MTKWTPERMRTPNGIDDAREMIVSIEAHGHPDQVDDPPPHSHLLNLALFSLNQAESQRAELEALYAACDDASTVIVRSELASECEPATALLGGFFQAVHAIRKHESNPYSDALRSQHATSGEDDSDE